jgi:hypothetical protein
VVIASLLGLFAMGMQSATVRLLMKSVASTNGNRHEALTSPSRDSPAIQPGMS